MMNSTRDNTTKTFKSDVSDVETAPYFPDVGHYATGSILACVYVFGTMCNATGLLTFIRSKQLRSPTNTFIFSLLIGDLCMCFFCAPMSMTSSFSKRWVWGKAGCDLEGFLVYFIGMANMYSLCAISLDRYVVIALPLYAPKITHRVAAFSVLLCWFGGFFWAVVPFFGWSYFHLEAAHTSCSIVWESDDPNVVSYNMAIMVFCYIIPVGLMFFAYFNVYMTIRRSNIWKSKAIGGNRVKTNAWDTTNQVSRKNLTAEKKMLRTVVIIMSLYLFAWTPYTIVSFWAVFVGDNGMPVWVQVIPAVAAKSSSALNPFVYLATNKQFRISFYNMIPCIGLRLRCQEIENERNKREKSEEEEDEGGKTKTVSKNVTGITDTSSRKNIVYPIHETESETQVVDFGKQSPIPSCSSHPGKSKLELQDIKEEEEDEHKF